MTCSLSSRHRSVKGQCHRRSFMSRWCSFSSRDRSVKKQCHRRPLIKDDQVYKVLDEMLISSLHRSGKRQCHEKNDRRRYTVADNRCGGIDKTVCCFSLKQRSVKRECHEICGSKIEVTKYKRQHKPFPPYADL